MEVCRGHHRWAVLGLVLLLCAGSHGCGESGGGSSVGAASTGPVVGTGASIGALRTDFGIYPEPALPSLPQAGREAVDPTFHSVILRLTDGADGNTSTEVQYSYWPAFNSDATRIHVVGLYNATRSVFFSFDKNQRLASNKVVLATPPSNGWLMERSDMIWSGTNPDIIYGHNDTHRLWAFNVASQQYQLVKDFTNDMVAGGTIFQMSKSLDDDVFAFTLTNASAQNVGYLVWRRSANAILYRQMVPNLDEVQLDRSGQFLTIGLTTGNVQIVTLATGASELLVWGVDGFYHHDSGQGTIFTGGVHQDYVYRSLQTPHSTVSLIPGYATRTTQDHHYSMLADNETWALVSRYSSVGGGVQAAFDNEIFQVATDGSQRIRRVAHHRSVYQSYNDSPKANISRDGRFVAFTSNWGQPGGRRDVYIAEISPAP
ncbi:MAG: hypothetical protein IT389_12815 [Nitrospira sp.]|nr:hypothetical protein [Nitrospira sp.]